MNHETRKVATLGIFAHANAGKTTITEHLLFHTNVIKEIGRVDFGNTVTDSMEVERKRGISVRASLVSFDLDDKTIQLIDTPGHADFSAEVERAISVLDGAVLVISGVEGPESQTYVIWNALKTKKIPVIFFINKMDRKGADFDRVVNEIKNSFNINLMVINRIDVSKDNIIVLQKTGHTGLFEQLADMDEMTARMFVNNDDIPDQDLNNRIIELTKSCVIFPVTGGSALTDSGMEELIECIKTFIPETTKKYSGNNDFSGFVYSIKIDENGKHVCIKVLKGTLENRDLIKIPVKTDEEVTQKVKDIFIPAGAELVRTGKIYCGDIAVLNGLDVKCGQIIGDRNSNTGNYISFVNPLLTMRIRPKNEDDTIGLLNSLKILNEEDPYLNVRYNKNTNSIYINLMGEIQAQIITTMLNDRFNIDASIDNPVVIYKEVPSAASQAKVSYTNVSGLVLAVTPLERGSGFVYKSKLSTDFLHIKYQRQVEKLIHYYSKQGLSGWELTDIEVALLDGQFDSTGSDPLHFNIIAPIALFRCLKKAEMKLLEPVCRYTITIPAENLNAVIKSLTIKNSVFEITRNSNKLVIIEGESPVALMFNYSIELAKITSGKGSYSSLLSRYELSKNQRAEIAFTGADPRNETTFLLVDMKAGLEPLDRPLVKKKESRAKKE